MKVECDDFVDQSEFVLSMLLFFNLILKIVKFKFVYELCIIE